MALALAEARTSGNRARQRAASPPPQFQRPLVVGAGPCGLFAALILAQSGFRPIILERGKLVREMLLAYLPEKHRHDEEESVPA